LVFVSVSYIRIYSTVASSDTWKKDFRSLSRQCSDGCAAKNQIRLLRGMSYGNSNSAKRYCTLYSSYIIIWSIKSAILTHQSKDKLAFPRLKLLYGTRNSRAEHRQHLCIVRHLYLLRQETVYPKLVLYWGRSLGYMDGPYP
jgi:hypothetical protein